jgi:hypothetical protein
LASWWGADSIPESPVQGRVLAAVLGRAGQVGQRGLAGGLELVTGVGADVSEHVLCDDGCLGLVKTIGQLQLDGRLCGL